MQDRHVQGRSKCAVEKKQLIFYPMQVRSSPHEKLPHFVCCTCRWEITRPPSRSQGFYAFKSRVEDQSSKSKSSSQRIRHGAHYAIQLKNSIDYSAPSRCICTVLWDDENFPTLSDWYRQIAHLSEKCSFRRGKTPYETMGEAIFSSAAFLRVFIWWTLVSMSLQMLLKHQSS